MPPRCPPRPRVPISPPYDRRPTLRPLRRSQPLLQIVHSRAEAPARPFTRLPSPSALLDICVARPSTVLFASTSISVAHRACDPVSRTAPNKEASARLAADPRPQPSRILRAILIHIHPDPASLAPSSRAPTNALGPQLPLARQPARPISRLVGSHNSAAYQYVRTPIYAPIRSPGRVASPN